MKTKFQKIVFWSFFIMLIFVTIELVARPGGGHSYSGGGGGGGYSDGGGGGDGIGILIWLIFELLPPYISIPLVIVILILYFYYKNKNKNGNKQVVSSPTYEYRNRFSESIESQINNLKNIDQNFSRVLFLDFVSSLFVKFQQFKFDNKKLVTIKPFISDKLFSNQTYSSAKVTEVVIGGINIVGITIAQQKTIITVEINANYTIEQNSKATRYITIDRWIVERNSNVLSLAPEKMQKLSCPSCGAPANFNEAGVCSYCGTLVVRGSMNWFVSNSVNSYLNVINTNSMLSYSPEIGTDYPTIFSSFLNIEIANFSRRNNTDFNTYWQYFQNNISKLYFLKIYENWQNLTWEKVRHLLTDRLWESYNFWIEAYKANGLKNMLQETTISKIDLAKIESDKYYESFTVRIFAAVKDYVVDKNGKVLVGSASRHRYFSEYWTFIRYNQQIKADLDTNYCPNCGSPIDKMGQSGICGYCNTKVNTGQFSWVLAFITQDEEYKG